MNLLLTGNKFLYPPPYFFSIGYYDLLRWNNAKLQTINSEQCFKLNNCFSLSLCLQPQNVNAAAWCAEVQGMMEVV